MIRKQLYIDEELDRALKVLAAWTGQSEAEHVRAALRRYIAEHALERPGDDPLLELVGMVDEQRGPKDAAANHDDYLYGPGRGGSRSKRAG